MAVSVGMDEGTPVGMQAETMKRKSKEVRTRGFFRFCPGMTVILYFLMSSFFDAHVSEHNFLYNIQK
jgi:hypothetical protein